MSRLQFSRSQLFALFTFLIITYIVTQFALGKLSGYDTRRWSFSYDKENAQVPNIDDGDGTSAHNRNTAGEKYLVGVGKADITGYEYSGF